MNKYLIFRTDRIGDFFLALILINSIKQNDPNSHITIVSSNKNHEYIKTFNIIDNVVLLNHGLINKIKVFFILKKNKYKSIIVHDDKKRSKLISFFLNCKKKIVIQNQKYLSHIDIIYAILKKLNFSYNDKSLNFLDQRTKSLNDKEWIQLHFDEKWINNKYIDSYTKIEPSTDDLISFINSLSNKTGEKLIITTGILAPEKLIKINQIIQNDKIKIMLNLSFLELEKIICKSKLVISCHGAISHVTSALQTNQIDIIDKSYDYSRWSKHFRNYKYLYRENFTELSKKILDIL